MDGRYPVTTIGTLLQTNASVKHEARPSSLERSRSQEPGF